MTQPSSKYDLEERTAQFGESVIILCRTIKQDSICSPIINQLIRSATSIGANYSEANAASSRKDFSNKIFICKKEAQETRHWLRMLRTALPSLAEPPEPIVSECQELTLIFQKITSSLRQNTGTLKIDKLKI
ncbi:hypothetical protein A3A71_01495 [Candidatus Berkelbacteria bacterium RIFCSPLOWO2_01_FULL_50_28]|uniref:Four helix bundle protein n=1 Tax=Candidatus Berkelbacteria bacterium RIFCSPLOWO2_01_FULL_50_28 TaxID=1797471 RepID=A0A1F5EBC0_9BACT|nr:MAG: hypothetical protein A2807_01320 [Candidatus Berkelbacteria bacterium RIFCSPHIGHO2_01_FULL_50_36]OGD62523.1 MAG: hypothetical protein A3F39_04380 [Candidatus Berkelbacteria bacterium RIFCSPHIGHO2_12_FULL_50_11]OGD64712.1 MAG: hypothetical protein A3A71_01495 [Candidatus Berkelbacteria bacterium RIFCSPLOWO2_01_FULL_50_28]